MTAKTTSEGKDLFDGGPRAFESQVRGVDGTRIYFRRKRGPSELTALLCDGIACDGFIWKYLWDELADRVSVAHFHYRGHGRSSAPGDSARIQVTDHAEDADAVRRCLGDPPCVIVGHSFGSQVALEAYRLRKANVRALVFLCGSFGRVTYTFKGTDLLANVLPDIAAFTQMHPHIARGLWSHVPVSVALAIARWTGDIDVSKVSADDVTPYFDHVKNLDFSMFVEMLRAAGEHSAEDLLPLVDVPTLVIAGDRDSFTPSEVSRAMAEAIPNAEFVPIKGGSHLGPLERREDVRRAIFDFLERRVGLAPPSEPTAA
jgi:pimeloyl-ACP methyl ester carboxylesterase